jgi:hypothetical protein
LITSGLSDLRGAEPDKPGRATLWQLAVDGMKRRPNKFVMAGLAVLHVVVVGLTWRDLGSRPAEQVRGNKKFWRVFSALNMGNAALYWLVGRRRG